MTSGFLYSLGQTHHILGSAEDGIVLSDKDITQDPQAVTTVAKASTAAIVLRLWERFRRRIRWRGNIVAQNLQAVPTVAKVRSHSTETVGEESNGGEM